MKLSTHHWLLFGLLPFLSLGGKYGGISMLVDPTGGALQMEGLLPKLPVPNFSFPGKFLLCVMGLFPLFVLFGLIRNPNWRSLERLTSWSNYPWPWMGSFAVGIILILWLVFQAPFIGFEWPIQYIMSIVGILILLLPLSPRIRNSYRIAK